MSERKLEATATPLPDNKLFGLHTEAVTITDDEHNLVAEITHNFGLGGAGFQLSVNINDRHIRETIDMRPLFQAWFEQVMAENDPEVLHA